MMAEATSSAVLARLMSMLRVAAERRKLARVSPLAVAYPTVNQYPPTGSLCLAGEQHTRFLRFLASSPR